MCTVFAESEVVSLLSHGENVHDIALGLHQSIINRIVGMMGRVGIEDQVVFAGGVAKNRCMREILAKKLHKKLLIPEEPQIVGAIGAALSAIN
jgi:activator of 2-hydroxyglutaryl-CoA dehydratase